MTRRYYKCTNDSDTGKQIAKFHIMAIEAQDAAERYADKMGASAYIQPVEYFAGGVEFLIFDKAPSSRVWKKREIGGGTYYEPNCKCKPGMLILDSQDAKVPDSKRGVRYGKKQPWAAVRNARTLDQWALIIGYTPTGDIVADRQHVERELGGKWFVSMVEYSGNKKALDAELARINLPVLETGVFLDAVDATDRSPKITPTFFLADDTYYIRMTDNECRGAELEEITEGEFDENLNKFFKQVTQ